jgi:hypothetical protein
MRPGASLLAVVAAATALGAETIRINLNGTTTPVPAQLRPGLFYNNTTSQANAVFDNWPVTCNLMRCGDLEYYLRVSSSYADVMSRVRSFRALYQQRAARADRFIIELGGMPYWLSRSQDSTPTGSGWRYFQTVGPRDYAVWDSLMRDIANEIRTWGFTPYYEFWNEPDLRDFWNGTEGELIGLYRHTAEAIKSAHPEARVGGFATNFWYKGIVTQMPTVYGWIPDSLVRRYAATAHLIDSCASSGTPLDFITWHQFAAYPRLADQAADFFRRQLDSAGLYATMMFITEYNTTGSTRETMSQIGLMVRFAERMAEAGIGGHAIASFQDFSSDPTREFFGDYGMLTRGALCKPAFRALEVLNLAARQGRQLPIDTALDGRLSVLATRQGSSVRILLGNNFLVPILDGYDALFWGVQRINSLDLAAAGYTTWGKIDSTIMGIYPPHGPPEVVAAFEDAGAAWAAAELFYYLPRTVTLTMTGLAGIARGIVYRVDSLHNNNIRLYDSLLANGWNRSSAVSYLYANQGLTGDSIVVCDTAFTLELAPNAVVLLDLDVTTSDIAEQRSGRTLPVLQTVVRGLLSIPASGIMRRASCVLLDLAGRKVLDLHPGANAVSRLAPGVYFVAEKAAGSRQQAGVRKVVIQR